MDLLKDIGKQLAETGLPWILAGDWNMSPEDLCRTGFLDKARGVVLQEPSAAATCLQGKGSVIDYFVCRQDLEPLLQPEGVVVRVPWRPHVGVAASLAARPLQLEVVRARRPRTIPEPTCEPMPWQAAEAAASTLLQEGGGWLGAPTGQMQGALRRQVSPAATLQLGLALSRFCLTLQVWRLSAAGIAPGDERYTSYLGRGQHMHMRRAPAVAGNPAQGAFGVQAAWWSTLASMLCQLGDLQPYSEQWFQTARAIDKARKQLSSWRDLLDSEAQRFL